MCRAQAVESAKAIESDTLTFGYLGSINHVVDIESIAAEEGPGYGGAMLAMVASGEYPDVKTIAEQFVKVTRVEKPDPELAALYEDRYQKFKAIYPSLKELFRTLA